MSKMTIAELFQLRKNDPRWNTSYPLNPSDWTDYRVPDSLSFENDSRMSFYIHIPFCKQLCSFCEYTRMLCPDENVQKEYLLAIANDIKQFRQKYQDITLLGFDIGGGTPTSLSEKNFSLLMQIYQTAISGLKLDDRYEPSIEGTFNTLSEEKLEDMAKNGFHRLSLGVQSSCSSVLHQHQRRYSSEAMMSSWLIKAWGKGIKKVNLDFMYGLKGQNESTIQQDLDLIGRLKPQQVTIYELRTNMILAKESFTKEELYDQYVHYYDGLLAMGYKARFGQNTFSLDAADEGLLRHDPVWMEEAIGNLIKNAVDHARCSRISLHLETIPGAVKLIVSDDGCGIPQQEIPHLFEHFGHKRKGHDVRSVGIGLAITRQIIEAHGGVLAVYSEPGHGTQIEILLFKSDTVSKENS